MRLMLFAAILAALAGCASSRYDALVRDYNSGQAPPYLLYATTAEPVVGETVPDTTTRVQADVEALKARWAKVLTEVATPAAVPAPPADVDASLAQPVDLATLLSLVPALNPQVAATRQSLRATLEQFTQAEYLDTILRQYNAFTKELDLRVGRQSQKQMQAMSFPFPDVLALKGKLVDEQAEIARQQFEIAVRDTRARMEQAYYDYLFVGDAIRVNRENQALIEQAIEVAQAKLRVARGKYNAVLMAQIELAKINDALITLEEQRGTIVAGINSLLARPPDAALGAPKPLPERQLVMPLDKLYAIAVSDRQELEQMRLRRQRMQTMIELARRMTYPDPDSGAGYYENRMQPAGTAMPAFATSRTVPTEQAVNLGQGDAYIRELGLRVDAMAQSIASLEDATRLAVKKAHFRLETARRELDLYRQSLLPQAEQAVETAMAAYRAGEIDFVSFLDPQRTLLKYRLQEVRAQRDIRDARARLEQLAGHPLPSVDKEPTP